MRRPGTDSCGCVIEVHGFSMEERGQMLPRLYRVLAASGCWTMSYRRCGRRAVEYSFEVELGAALELYCGLVQAGVEMTEVSHRALTELCALRTYERALRGSGVLTPRLVSVRLRISFVEADKEMEVAAVVAASA